MKKTTLLKRMALILTLCMLLACIPAYAAYEHDPNINEPGVYPVCKEPVKLTVGIQQSPNVEDFETNKMTQLLEEYGNFDLEFVLYPASEMNEKINLIVNSGAGAGDLPDILISEGFDDSQVYSWALAGALVDLTEYYENSAYHLKIAEERTGTDFKKMITAPDGCIYSIPAYNQSLGNEAPARLWIYQPWLDKLNLEVPETPEDLYTVLKAFKEQDPNGNGIADEVPLMSYAQSEFWLHYLMKAFINSGNAEFFAVNDGTVFTPYTTEEWREGLRFIKKLFDEGLISSLTYTQDRTQFGSALTGEETVVGAMIDMCTSSIMPASDMRRTEYVGVAPLTGADGKSIAHYIPSVAKPCFLITSGCENIEAAFSLGDLLVSEELSIITRFGFPGDDYKLPEEGDVALYADMGYEPTLTPISPWGVLQNTHWAQIGPFIRQYSIAAGMISDGNPANTEPMQAAILPAYIETYPEEVIPKLVYSIEELESIQESKTMILSYVRECTALFVTGAMDIETEWATYLNELDAMGIDMVVNTVQPIYDRMYK